MIRVCARLYATLRAFSPGLKLGEALPVELPDESNVRELAQHLGLPLDEVKIVFVNGFTRELEYTLHDGDELGIFPAVGGG
jgi:molybdopterin converting factor small subunit